MDIFFLSPDSNLIAEFMVTEGKTLTQNRQNSCFPNGLSPTYLSIFQGQFYKIWSGFSSMLNMTNLFFFLRCASDGLSYIFKGSKHHYITAIWPPAYRYLSCFMLFFHNQLNSHLDGAVLMADCFNHVSYEFLEYAK